MNWLNDMLQSDPDPQETREWIDSMQAVIEKNGALRAHQLLEGMVEVTRRAGAYLPFSPTTEYVNTIAPQNEAKSPGDAALEWRIRSIIRWNAMATVVRANRKLGDLGGHIAWFASGGHALRRGLQPLLARAQRQPPGRPAVHPGPQRAGYLRPLVPGRPHQRAASSTTSAWKWTARASRPTRTRG